MNYNSRFLNSKTSSLSTLKLSLKPSIKANLVAACSEAGPACPAQTAPGGSNHFKSPKLISYLNMNSMRTASCKSQAGKSIQEQSTLEYEIFHPQRIKPAPAGDCEDDPCERAESCTDDSSAIKSDKLVELESFLSVSSLELSESSIEQYVDRDSAVAVAADRVFLDYESHDDLAFTSRISKSSEVAHNISGRISHEPKSKTALQMQKARTSHHPVDHQQRHH